MDADNGFHGIVATLARSVVDQTKRLQEPDDAESIHRLRVVIARLRAVLSAFVGVVPSRYARHVRRELKWLRQAFAAVREWDVFLASGSMRLHSPDERCAVEQLLKASVNLRIRALKKMVAALRSQRCAKLMQALRVLPDAAARIDADSKEQERIAATTVLDSLLAKVHRRGQHLYKHDPEQFHCLRIRLKHLRYVGESLQPLFVRPADTYLDALAGLLHTFGNIQDAAVSGHLAQGLKHRLGHPVHHVAKHVERHHKATLRHQRRQLQSGWKDFKQLTPFWEP